MDCYESITRKLKEYLLKNKGFKEVNGTLTKTLTKKEDMIYAKDLFKRIASGMIPYGMKFAYGTMEDNYRSIIEENFEDWIELTDEERDYLCGHQLYDEDEANDDDEDTGWDYVDQWILDNVEVMADRKVVDDIAREEFEKYKGIKHTELTFDEYSQEIGRLSDELFDHYTEELYNLVSEFQTEHMNRYLEEYEKTVNGDRMKQVCYELLRYAVKESRSGNAIVDVEWLNNEDDAEKLQDKIFEEIGQYLLDDCQVYEENPGKWVADVMFGGGYVPYWDGWKED